MLRQLVGHAALYTASALTSRLIGLALILVLSRSLSRAEFGLLDLSNAAASLCNLILCLEINQGLGRRFADHAATEPIIRYTSTAFLFSLGMALAFTGSALAFPGQWAGVLYGDPARIAEMRAASFLVLGSILAYALTRQARWELRPGLATAMALIQSAVALTLATLAVVGLGYGVPAVLATQAIGAGLAAALGLIGLRRSLRLSFSWAALKEMLRFSLPLVPAGGAVFINSYADRYCLNYFGGLDYVGSYGVAIRIGSAILLVVVGIQTAFMPLFAKQVDKPETLQAVADAFRLTALLALVGFVGLGLFAPELTALIAGPRFAGSAALVPWLAAGTLLGELSVFAPGLFVKRRTGWLLWISLSAAALNILLNLLLVPRLGPIGSAIGLLAGSSLSFAVSMVLSHRLLPVPIEWSRLGAMAGFTVAVVVLGGIWPGFAVKAGLFLLAGLGLLAVLVKPAERQAWLNRARARLGMSRDLLLRSR